MSIKKLVGAVTALTMASSVFAGFTTVANADGTNEENNQERTFITDMKNKKVTYYAEAEDLYGAEVVDNQNCSGGKGAYFTEDTIIMEKVLMSGIYQIEAGVFGDGSKDITIKVEPVPEPGYTESDEFYYTMPCSTAGGYQAHTKDTIFLRRTSNIIITASDENNLLDYIYITEPEVTISARGVYFAESEDDLPGIPLRSFTADFEMDKNHAPVTGIEFTVGKTDNFDKPFILEDTKKEVEFDFGTTLTGEGKYIMGLVVYGDKADKIANPTAVLITKTED